VTPLRDPVLFRDSDVEHFAASFGAVLHHDLDSDRSVVNLMDFGSWGGDLLSALGDFVYSGLPGSDAYEFARDHIASMADNTFFTISDFIADVDAMVFGLQTKSNSSLLLSYLFQQYYAGPGNSPRRFWEFLQNRFNGSYDTLLAASRNMFFQDGDVNLVLYRNLFWHKNFGDSGYDPIFFVPDEMKEGVARAFADIVRAHA
jgi:hypothetical protein